MCLEIAGWGDVWSRLLTKTSLEPVHWTNKDRLALTIPACLPPHGLHTQYTQVGKRLTMPDSPSEGWVVMAIVC